MGFRRLTGVFAILCVLLYFAYTYWGWDQVAVLVLSMVSGVATLVCLVMSALRPGIKRTIDRG